MNTLHHQPDLALTHARQIAEAQRRDTQQRAQARTLRAELRAARRDARRTAAATEPTPGRRDWLPSAALRLFLRTASRTSTNPT